MGGSQGSAGRRTRRTAGLHKVRRAPTVAEPQERVLVGLVVESGQDFVIRAGAFDVQQVAGVRRADADVPQRTRGGGAGRPNVLGVIGTLGAGREARSAAVSPRAICSLCIQRSKPIASSSTATRFLRCRMYHCSA